MATAETQAPLSHAQVHDLQVEVAHLIPAFRIERAAEFPDQVKLARLGNRIVDIGDILTRQVVCGCDSLDALLEKWPAHHYRPTLRRDDSCATLLADVYDLVAEVRGLDVVAYRGS